MMIMINSVFNSKCAAIVQEPCKIFDFSTSDNLNPEIKTVSDIIPE